MIRPITEGKGRENPKHDSADFPLALIKPEANEKVLPSAFRLEALQSCPLQAFRHRAAGKLMLLRAGCVKTCVID
jgi:hypothetical protein